MSRHTAYVDVGGTLTRVVVQDASQRVIKNMSFTASLSTLKTQVQAALQPYKPEKVLFGIRGVWTPAERARWKSEFKQYKAVQIMSDVELAHHLVFKDMPGILLNAGTGSIAYGRSPNGKTARAGGLGPLLGDEGSGFWIGRQYLKKIYKTKHDLNFVRAFAKHADPVQKIATLAKPLIERTYQRKDKFGTEIIGEAQKYLRFLAEDVASQLSWRGEVPIKLVGGLFHNTDFKKTFIQSLPRGRFKPF